MNSRGRIRQYIIKKSAFIFPSILGITFLIFLLMNTSGSTSAQTENLFYRNLSGFGNIFSEYISWIRNVITLDFGKSLRDGRPVWDKIIERLPATLELNLTALLMTVLIGIPLGVWQAYRKNSRLDRSLTFITFLFYSIPAFWLGLILVILLGVILPDITNSMFGFSIGLPTSERRSLNFILYPQRYSFIEVVWDRLRHIIIPAFTFSIVNIATIARYVRSNMISVLKEDYIVTARSKGLSENRVLFRHALKNSLISTVTFIAFLIPTIIGSSFIIEVVFSWPGIGRLGYNSILARDYPVVMAIGLIIAILTLLSNLLADILYYYLDPRIRARK